MKNIKLSYRKLLYPAIICAALFAIFPLAGMFAYSFLDYNIITGFGGEVGFQNYIKLLSDRGYLNSIYVTLMLTGFGVIAQLIVGTFIAIGLKEIIPKSRLAVGAFTVPFAVPHVAVALIWMSLFTPGISPINSFLHFLNLPAPAWFGSQVTAIAAIVIADTWSSFPFVMLLILSALQGISEDINEAASIDGAGKIFRTFKITIPLIAPALILAGLFRVIETLKHFPLIYIMTKGGPGNSTEATHYYAYVKAFLDGEFSYSAAITVTIFLFAALISLVLSIFNQKQHYES